MIRSSPPKSCTWQAHTPLIPGKKYRYFLCIICCNAFALLPQFGNNVEKAFSSKFLSPKQTHNHEKQINPFDFFMPAGNAGFWSNTCYCD